MKIMHSIYRDPSHKVFSERVIKDLQSGVESGEISFERMVEIMNCIASGKIDAWKRYSESLNDWWLKYRDNPASWEAGMSKPNKPGYVIANND